MILVKLDISFFPWIGGYGFSLNYVILKRRIWR